MFSKTLKWNFVMWKITSTTAAAVVAVNHQSEAVRMACVCVCANTKCDLFFFGLLITRYDIKSNWWTQTKYNCAQHTHIFMPRNAYNILCFFSASENPIHRHKKSYVCTEFDMFQTYTHFPSGALEVFLSFFAKSDLLMPILFVLLCTPFFRLTDRKAIMLQYMLFDNGSSEWGENFTRKKNTEHGKFSFDCISFALSRCLEMLCMCVCVCWVFLCEPEKGIRFFSLTVLSTLAAELGTLRR